MSVDRVIDEIFEILDVSWHLPLSGGKVIADSKEIRCLLEDVKLKLPKEIIQAKSVVADRNKILEDAKSEAENLIKAAEEKVRSMVKQSEIVKLAQTEANKIVNEAKVQSKEMRFASTKYVDDVMKQLEQTINSSLSEVKKARHILRCPESSESSQDV